MHHISLGWQLRKFEKYLIELPAQVGLIDGATPFFDRLQLNKSITLFIEWESLFSRSGEFFPITVIRSSPSDYMPAIVCDTKI
jgi:hypothetical protein